MRKNTTAAAPPSEHYSINIVLTFPTNALADSLEKFLEDIYNGPGQSLRSPIKLDWGGPVGGAVQGAQVISTWAQLPEANRTLRLSGSFAQNAITRERFAATLPGMAALYFSKRIESEGESFSRFKALESVGRRVHSMQTGDLLDTLRGPGVALCCFGGAKNEFLNVLYEKPIPEGVRPLSDFTVLMHKLLHAAGGSATRAISDGQITYLSALVYQLFLNAEEHGSYDANMARLDEMMRGIVLRVTPISKAKTFVAASASDSPLRAYISRLAFGNRLPKGEEGEEKQKPKTIENSKPLWLVELSVFDTGPGLAMRWLSDKEQITDATQFTAEKELEAVMTCFRKHSTTKGSNFRGEGLNVALRSMRQLQAFMTLRTGRYSLYQDFSRGGDPVMDFKPKHRLARRHVLNRIAGTAYNITFLAK